MKKIHLLLLGTFIGPFGATLFITNFLLLMIWFWKWLEDIVGKGLEMNVILELIGYASLNQIPMSLPLAMLLSSIMTFGKLGETVELTAMKALGISMWRIMKPLLVVALLFSATAFYINNNILPVTNTKLKSLLRDITAKKPELSIPEGIFYKGLDGYTIRVGKKNRDKTLKDVLIFDNKSNSERFITADSGRLEMSKSGKDLVLLLYNGTAYEYQKENYKKSKKRRYPLVRNNFYKNQLIFDLEAFSFERSEDSFDYDARLKNTRSILYFIDSIQKNIVQRKKRLLKDMHRNYFLRSDSTINNDTLNYDQLNVVHTLDTLERTTKVKITRHASDIAHNAKQTIYGAKVEINNDAYTVTRHQIEFHKKITFSVACLLLFFVGAPFGAIYKKGGLGAPVVISAIVFVVYHVLTLVGEKLAKNGEWSVFNGIWLSVYILAPLGIILMLKVTNQNILDWRYLKKFFKK